jgi:glutathione S-transferase
MKLYSLDLSPFAARVRAVIYAKGLKVEIVKPEEADWRNSLEYRQLNSLVRIPLLVLEDGSPLPESAVIVEYLEEAYPEPALLPKPPKERARVRYITQVAEHYVLPHVYGLLSVLDTQERDPPAIAAALHKLERTLGNLNDLLQPGEYAFGNRLTTADAWLTPLRFSLEALMRFWKRPDLLNPYPALTAYADVARKDPHLGRVWSEMEEGYKVDIASQAAA